MKCKDRNEHVKEQSRVVADVLLGFKNIHFIGHWSLHILSFCVSIIYRVH